jgi:hypothetical protein
MDLIRDAGNYNLCTVHNLILESLDKLIPLLFVELKVLFS